MPATPISNPIPREDLIGIEPQLLQQVDPGWRRRLNLFIGRTLSDTALESEQNYRAGLLATLAQAVTPGTVSGLELTIDTSGTDPVLAVTPGYGLAASGEDVSLPRNLKTNLSTLAVVDPVSGVVQQTFHEYTSDPANPPSAGILLLQPVIAQVSGQVMDTGSGPIEVTGNLETSCDPDPDEYAFEDWQIADGVRLVFVPWPTGVQALTLPDRSPAATYRNRLVYTIFNAEEQLGPDDQFPWNMLGVPVALIAFDPDHAWAPLFVDRSAVVRRGGLPRRCQVLPTESQPSRSWQAKLPFAAGQFILDPNGNVQKVRTPGTSGGSPPTWNAARGKTTSDGSVTWINNGPGSWQPGTAFGVGQFILDPNGNLQTVQVAGTSGSSQPAWNGTYLPTSDGTVTWINNGSGEPPIVQPALAEARILQLAEQFAETLSGGQTFTTLADLLPTLPPAGVLPAKALDFANRSNVWFPPNWSLSVGPVHLAELETVLQTGMAAAAIDAETSRPSDPTFFEPVEVLVPLPDQVYDPRILVTERVATVFQQEVGKAIEARNETLRERRAIQIEANVLAAAIGPNSASGNPNLIDPNGDLTPAEMAGRNFLPAYLPQPNSDPNADETFGIHGPATWTAGFAYVVGQFVYDPSGNIQSAQTAGTSGSSQPSWNGTPGQTTSDGTDGTAVTWLNVGPGAWQPNTAYVPGQFLFDANGSMQAVQVAGTSGKSQYIWNPDAAETADGGIVWINSGQGMWQARIQYTSGQFVLDSNGNLQVAQGAGISGGVQPVWEVGGGLPTLDGTVTWINYGQPGTWLPSSDYAAGQVILDANRNLQTAQLAGKSGNTQYIWNPNSGQNTQDGSVTWVNQGPGTWQANTEYAEGQFVLDSNGNTQSVQAAGTSGGAQPRWSLSPGQTTADGSVIWFNNGAGTWRAGTAYTAGQFIFDPSGNLQTVQTAGQSGSSQPAWNSNSGQTTLDGSVTWVSSGWASVDLQKLLNQVGGFSPVPPAGQDSGRKPLFGDDDKQDLLTNGLQHFIDRINAKIGNANDLIDLAFLTMQTDIYRVRQNVLGAGNATKLAISPILANIATGDTAAATAENLQNYFKAIPPTALTLKSGGGGTPPPAPPSPPSQFSFSGTPTRIRPFVSNLALTRKGEKVTPKAIMVSPIRTGVGGISSGVFTGVISGGVSSGISGVITGVDTGTLFGGGGAIEVSPGVIGGISPAAPSGPAGARGRMVDVGALTQFSPARASGGFSMVTPGTSATPASPTDIVSQSPVVGAQLSLRTLTIAERLAPPPSQDSIFYSVANRLAFLQLLLDLELTVDDLPVLVDAPPPATPDSKDPYPMESHTVEELRTDPTLFSRVQAVQVNMNVDEATLFSTGVRVLEQHSQLLRAIESRINDYQDFVNQCTTALANLQDDLQRAQTHLTKLQNGLMQARQNVAFTTALLNDEVQRVAAVNAQRTQVLQNSVTVLVYTRARTLQIEDDDTPSRQLVPGDVANPAPDCTEQTAGIPPELREMVALLREAPVSWLPSVQALLGNLERPSLLLEMAVSTQARAALQLQLPMRVSSAAGAPRVYAPVVAGLYSASQQLFRGFQMQRASFQPAGLANLSWQSRVSVLQGVAAVGDLIASEAVHAEVVNATSLLIQQISGVATCLYTRANLALPIERLAWAEFLRGPGASLGLQSLAILPRWNERDYVDRQQMQMLVDWLFQQIDNANGTALAFMSDVVRTAILLASDVPLNDVITGSIAVRTQPAPGSTVTLSLPSNRVAKGMYIQLYSQSDLAARAVVSDLDAASVRATVTDVYKTGVYLETSDMAHFTAQAPEAVALRGFST